MSRPDKKLQAQWDAKLKKSGFEDAETKSGQLKAWHKLDIMRRFQHSDAATKMEYFVSAGRFLYDHKFESATDRAIWELHCQGMTLREILKVLQGSQVASKWKVHQIVLRLKKEMVRSWKE